MGFFFKRFKVDLNVSLTDGSEYRGTIDLGGTILSSQIELEKAIWKVVNGRFGEGRKDVRYSIKEV